MLDKFSKVDGNYIPRIILPLEGGGNILTLPDETADIFADYYEKILRDLHKKSKPRKNRKRKKEKELPYSNPFTDRELKTAIKTTKEYSTWRRYYTSPDDKKNYHQKHEILARHV